MPAAPTTNARPPAAANGRPKARSQGQKATDAARAGSKHAATGGPGAQSRGQKAADAPRASAKQGTRNVTPAAPPAAEPRRFAWAPVDGAVAYRLELFRGQKQVFEARTVLPVYELPGTWRHAGRTERLTTGSYRWYVWPVLPSGPADTAVVQARLTVP